MLDNNLKPKAIYANVGVGWTDCISQGPHQYFFASNSNPNGNPPGTWAITGEIYKMELDGTIIGKFGHAGKEFGGFQVVHMMDCRNPEPDRRRRNRILARAEVRPEAAGRQRRHPLRPQQQYPG